MKYIKLLSSLLFLALISGCSFTHPVADDYGQYLDNNTGNKQFPKSGLDAQYLINQHTQEHRYEFRSATVGYANLWVVEFGNILKETLKSKDVQNAFTKLTPNRDAGYEGHLISFDLEKYEFKDHMAHISMNISLQNKGISIINKTYHAQGKSQGGKMFWGGAFAMKNATQQSTKFAIDQILTDFINDINKI